MQFNKDILKQAYQEELRHFRIRSNGTNAIKQLLDRIDDMTRQGHNQLTKEQLLSVIAQTNMFTTADIVAYCLQTYYDQREREREHDEEFDINESLYSSGIERTNAYFDDAPCLPPYSHEVPKVDYIEKVLFQYFSSYMIKMGYRELVEIYRYMIRFGCILNPRSNIIVLLFNNLSNNYFLQSPNLDEGSEYGYTDRNMFTGQRKVVNLSSKMYSQITRSSYQNVTGQPLFILTIDYGNIITLDARPYAYVLQALFYMRDNNVRDYEGTKIRIIQQEETDRWLEARTQGFLQAGGKGRIKSKKNKKVKVNKKTHYSRNKSRRHRRRRKSAEKR